MPERENEFWVGQKQDLRYCYKHKRYYRAPIGCQLCGYEAVARKGAPRNEATADPPRLKFCAACEKRSLFWNPVIELWECFNPSCKAVAESPGDHPTADEVSLRRHNVATRLALRLARMASEYNRGKHPPTST